jgi:hypothetical protein
MNKEYFPEIIESKQIEEGKDLLPEFFNFGQDTPATFSNRG